MPGVVSISDPRFWPLDGESIVGTIHVFYDTPLTSQTNDKSVSVDPSTLAVEVETVLRSWVQSLDTLHVQMHPTDPTVLAPEKHFET